MRRRPPSPRRPSLRPLADTLSLARSLAGVKELATGLAPPNLWDLAADKQRMGEEHPLQVARCTKILKLDENAPPPALAPGQKPNADEQDKYVINVKQIAKFVVALGDRVAPTDIEEGMRVGSVLPLLSLVWSPPALALTHCALSARSVDRTDYKIMIPLPPKIDASVTMMQVEDKPDVTYQDVGGCKEQIDKLREVVETPLLTVRRPSLTVHVGVVAVGAALTPSSPSLFLFLSLPPSSPSSLPHRSPKSSPTSASTRPRASCCTALPARARRCARAPSPTAPTPPSSASSAPSSCRSTSARGRGWCASCSRWLGRRRPAWSSSTRSTPSAVRGTMTGRAATTRSSARCSSSSTSWTASTRGVISRYSWRRTGACFLSLSPRSLESNPH